MGKRKEGWTVKAFKNLDVAHQVHDHQFGNPLQARYGPVLGVEIAEGEVPGRDRRDHEARAEDDRAGEAQVEFRDDAGHRCRDGQIEPTVPIQVGRHQRAGSHLGNLVVVRAVQIQVFRRGQGEAAGSVVAEDLDVVFADAAVERGDVQIEVFIEIAQLERRHLAPGRDRGGSLEAQIAIAQEVFDGGVAARGVGPAHDDVQLAVAVEVAQFQIRASARGDGKRPHDREPGRGGEIENLCSAFKREHEFQVAVLIEVAGPQHFGIVADSDVEAGNEMAETIADEQPHDRVPAPDSLFEHHQIEVAVTVGIDGLRIDGERSEVPDILKIKAELQRCRLPEALRSIRIDAVVAR